MARFYRRLAARSRLILFDARGTGMSDKVQANELPDLESRMDDLKVVLDANCSKRAVLFGIGEASHLCLIFAATYPDRTAGLVLHAGDARDTPTGDTPWDILGQQVATLGWRRDLALRYLNDAAPSLMTDEAACDWWVRSVRLCLSPAANTAYDQMVWATDVRSVLPAIQAPALVLCPKDDAEYLPASRELAAAIPDARLVEFAGGDRVPWAKDQEVVLDEVERFLDRLDSPADADRILATLLSTDIVGSTERAQQLGDRRWRGTAGAAQSARSRRARTASGPRGRHRGRRLPGGLRRPRPRHPLRACDLGAHARARHRGASRPAHGRVRAPRGRTPRRDRAPHLRPRRSPGSWAGKSSSRGRSRISWPGRASLSTIAGSTSSRESPSPGSCTQSPADNENDNTLLPLQGNCSALGLRQNANPLVSVAISPWGGEWSRSSLPNPSECLICARPRATASGVCRERRSAVNRRFRAFAVTRISRRYHRLNLLEPSAVSPCGSCRHLP